MTQISGFASAPLAARALKTEKLILSRNEWSRASTAVAPDIFTGLGQTSGQRKMSCEHG